MANEDEKYIGSLKYCGKLVDHGMLDARKSAQALTGFDEAIRFFAIIQNPKFQEIDLELPVKIRQGSWEAYIPDAIFWAKTIAGITGTAYLAKAAQKMAENDFENVGIKTILSKSLEAVQWVIRIGKHLGTISIKKFEQVKFRKENTEIGIPNNDGQILWVPKYYLDLYSKCPKNLLEKIVALVEEERQLYLGANISGETVVENVSSRHKFIFIPENETDILFPELVHGMEVKLQGEVTRGNETTNTMGFRYNEHILTAYPKTGSIVRFKECLFLEADIYGSISRLDENGEIKAKRPKIIFTDIKPIERKSSNLPLFSSK
jgi:hypothetical protein